MAAERQPVRIVLADDHTLLREAVRDVLTAEDDLFVVGEAADGDSLVSTAARMRPDVVLMDVEMPRSVPTETVRRVLSVSPASRVLVLSMHDAPQIVRDMVACGVSGFLHKSISRHGLTSAIRTSVEAGPASAPGVRRLVMSVSQEALMRDPGTGDVPISPREREVLTLVAAACSNRQIASRLKITEATVKRHLRNAFEKLGAVSRIDAVNKATEQGLIGPARTDWRPTG